MPTPPWHGHLLRGITEMSRKPGTAYNCNWRRPICLYCMWRAKQTDGDSVVNSAVYLTEDRGAPGKVSSIYSLL